MKNYEAHLAKVSIGILQYHCTVYMAGSTIYISRGNEMPAIIEGYMSLRTLQVIHIVHVNNTRFKNAVYCKRIACPQVQLFRRQIVIGIELK